MHTPERRPILAAMSAPPLSDALGRPVRLAAPPRRVVSLVPSQTELLAALGLDDEVVGLTRFCVHPSGWKARKGVVGGTKNVSAERVAALRPDLVIANKEENVRADVEALSEIAPVYVTDVSTVEGAVSMIRDVGALVGRAAAAERVAAAVEGSFAGAATAARRRVAYLIWRDPWMTVGGDTFISDVLARCGLDNAFADRTRYPAVTADELAGAGPDVVLLSSEPFPFRSAHLGEVRAFVPRADVRLVDGEAISWYGPRMQGAPDALRSAITSG